MNRFRSPQFCLVLIFLGIISSVPMVQFVIEALHEDEVRVFGVFNQSPTASNLRSYEQSLETANWAAAISRPWLQFAQFECLKDGGEKAIIGRSGWYFYKPGLNYMLARHEETGAARATNDPVAAIVDFRDQLAERGIRLLVMPVPNKESIYPDQLTSRASARGVLAPRTRAVLESLLAAGVEVLDLFKEFGEHRKLTESALDRPLYLTQDTHWSPSGVELAARAVARRLTELGWVKPGGIEYREQTALVRRLGDILRMMQVPLIEQRLDAESIECSQIIRCDNAEPYKDSPEAEILIIGDSFMRIYQTDEPKSAGFIAHLAKELKAPMFSLVNDGGGSTLVRQELSGRPVFLKNKKVVIWEFVERDIGLGLHGWKHVQFPPVASPKSTGVIDSPSDVSLLR